jgi:hypothetical protein
LQGSGAPEETLGQYYPYNPGRVLARAYLNGLSALRDLLRERVTTDLEYVFDRTQQLWTEALERWNQSKESDERDFSHITEVERHLRRNYLKMVWESTARYGNTEYKRVKSERQGRVGPLNRMLNIVGALLRNYALTRFPFDPPQIVGRRGRRHIAVYEGDETYGTVKVNHTTMAELDFVDMIRNHLVELCRKDFINTVPDRELNRYATLLIWRLSPFLEYLYTSGEAGRWGFKRSRQAGDDEGPLSAEEILREIVDELEAIYGTHLGRAPTVTERLTEEKSPRGMSLFLDESLRLRGTDDTDRVAWGRYLRTLCDEGNLREGDALRIQDEAQRRARWYGIKTHELVTAGLPQPYNLKSVVLNGDSLASAGSELLIAAEVPLKPHLGAGRADLVVLRRELLDKPGCPEDIAVWRPIAVLDIKTKTAFNWHIEGEEKESKRYGKITVPDFRLRRRRTTDAEWAALVDQAPDKYGRSQLDVYATALKREFTELTEKPTAKPVTGTVVLDVSQDRYTLQKNIRRLVWTLFSDHIDDLRPHVGERLVVQFDEYELQDLRLALVIESVNHGQRQMLAQSAQALTEERMQNRVCPHGNVILYVPVSASARSGPSAAWISQY